MVAPGAKGSFPSSTDDATKPKNIIPLSNPHTRTTGFQGTRICMAEPPRTKSAAYNLLLLYCQEPQTYFVKIFIVHDCRRAGGFGHVGNDCTFETLAKTFNIKDSKLRLVAEAIHDADLADEHFGRTEALGIDRILDGWNKQGVGNEEVLRRGTEMIEGLYNGIR
jgi:Chromate resistance exported protein